MKYTITKKNVLSKIMLLILMTSATRSYTCSHNNEINTQYITHLTEAFVAIERNLADFFSSTIKTPYNNYVIAIEKILKDLEKQIEPATRFSNDPLTIATHEIIDYGLQQFNIAYRIIKKYNGKPAGQASDFSSEIKREFNTEKIFGEMVSKLKALRCKADSAGNKQLVKKIDTLMQIIQKKRSDWNAKADWALFAGLSNRMNCR